MTLFLPATWAASRRLRCCDDRGLQVASRKSQPSRSWFISEAKSSQSLHLCSGHLLWGIAAPPLSFSDSPTTKNNHSCLLELVRLDITLVGFFVLQLASIDHVFGACWDAFHFFSTMTRLLLPFSEFCRMTCTTILVRQSSPSHRHIQHAPFITSIACKDKLDFSMMDTITRTVFKITRIHIRMFEILTALLTLDSSRSSY